MRKDWLIKSDPHIVVLQRNSPDGEWIIIGRTEVIRNDTDPDFKTEMDVVLLFESCIS